MCVCVCDELEVAIISRLAWGCDTKPPTNQHYISKKNIQKSNKYHLATLREFEKWISRAKIKIQFNMKFLKPW